MNKNTLVSALLVAALLAVGCGASEPEPQRVEIEVGASGYTPSEVRTSAGTPLTLVFTRTTDEGCGGEVVIASQNIRRELPLDEPVEISFTPTEAGELRFTCGMDMFDGAIVVQ
ncbi:MAG: cupredoxin domain-containing protein [Sandaracinaceae bacterium]